MDVMRTSRLALHPIDADEGRRIVARRAGSGDRWAADFPFDGDVVAVSAFLRETAEQGEQRPFGYYRIDRAADGLAVGGIGFKGRPRDGRVEVGFGLVPEARGHGYAAEALTGLVTVAAGRGLTHVVADTVPGNIASQCTLERAGFVRVDSGESLHRYELVLTQR